MRPEIIEFPNKMPVKAFVRSIEQYPYHWHDALEIVQVLKGSVNISLGDDNLLLQENDLAVINMDELHRLTESRQDNEILFIQIDSNFYRNILPDNRYLFIYCCSAYHETEAPAKYKKLKEHIARLIWALNEKSPGDDKKNIEAILGDMLAYITYNFDFLRWGYGTVAFDEKQVERLKQIAEQTSKNYNVHPGLKDLAAAADVSMQHLSNHIKDKFGLTFKKLLYYSMCYSMCEQAARLLLSTGERIVDIAMECGFSDPKYLIKHFRQYFQCTPSGFRKMHRADDKTLASQMRYRDFPFSEAMKYLKSQKSEF